MAASYPGTLPSFTPQTDVANAVTGPGYVNATDINELQDEIVAIATELGTDVAGTHANLVTRLAGIENAGDLYVAGDAKIGMEGVSGDTYLTYDVTNTRVKLMLNNTFVEQWDTALMPFLFNVEPTGTVGLATDEGWFHRVYVPRYIVVDTLKFEVTVASTAGTAEVGLYDSAGTKLVSAGSIDTTSTGVKSGSMSSQALAPGFYWVAISNDEGITVRGAANGGDWLGTSHSGKAASQDPLPGTVPSLSANTSIVSLMALVS
jgi:hypothetical protein